MSDEIRDELAESRDDMSEPPAEVTDLPPEMEPSVPAEPYRPEEEGAGPEDDGPQTFEEADESGGGPVFVEDDAEEIHAGPGDEIPDGPEEFPEGDDGPDYGGRPSGVAHRVQERLGASGRGVVDEPVFDTQAAPVPMGDGFASRLVEQKIEDGLGFLLLAHSPSKYLNERAQAIVHAAGNRIEPVRAGDPMLVPPHASQNRVAASGFEPQASVRKPATRRGRVFSADTLLDRETAKRAAPVPAPQRPVERAQEGAAELSTEGVGEGVGPVAASAPLIVQLAPAEEGEVAPQASPLRFHSDTASENAARAEKDAKDKKKGGEKAGEPRKGASKPREPLFRLPGLPEVPWAWVGMGAAIMAAAGVLAVGFVWASQGQGPDRSDAVVVYAMDQREQAVASLTREIGLLEGSVAQVEADLNRLSQQMPAQPTSTQWAELQKLARERNSQVIALEALRLRRKLILRGDNR